MKIDIWKSLLTFAILSIGMFDVAVKKADAVPITFNFAGNVTHVDPSLGSIFSVGQTLSGSYTFESTAADGEHADPALGRYDALTALSFTIGSYAGTWRISGNEPWEFGVTNSTPLSPIGNGDFYDLFAAPVSPRPSAGSVSPTDDHPKEELLKEFWQFGLRLRDDTASALSSDALPVTPPDLALFTSATWFFEYLPFGNTVAGRLTTLTLAIPEPSSLVLLISGLAGLGLRARRRR